jgi:acetolactate synthase-1/2/3 large subunit
LMGLGAYPASGPAWLGPLGMHGTYEANLCTHRCDLLICLGARFDDRVTGRVDAFSPNSKKIHLDVDPSQINKNIRVDLPIIADAARALRAIINEWQETNAKSDSEALAAWWERIAEWRNKKSLSFKNSDTVIKPQFAIDRLYELTRGRETYITTEVGQHQMWAMQRFKFEEPNHWMTSGGLGTMGYGLPAAVGVQTAHPDALVIDIAGEASVQMTMQEMATAMQHDLPIKIFIINNKYMGMVRQWQQLLHGGRYSHSYSEALPDFVKMAEAFGAVGLRAEKPGELDAKIQEMIDVKAPVIFDCVVDPYENCYPMIPSGAAHDEMILSDSEDGGEVSEVGKVLV